MSNRPLIQYLKENLNSYERISWSRPVRHAIFLEKGIKSRKQLSHKAEDTLNSFSVGFASEKEKQDQIRDMLRMYTFYGYSFDEYVLYRFQTLSKKERLSFVADWEHSGYTRILNNSRNNSIFDDKWNTYLRFREFYGRDVLLCDSEDSREPFLSFTEQHRDYIVKPIDFYGGSGIRIVHEGDAEFEKLMEEYHGRFLIEELIHQAEIMAKFHPNSVNTVRVPTIRMDDGVHILHPVFRLGQKGSVVDNSSAGGIISIADVESGIIKNACDELGHEFVHHPDTGEQIIGFQIPRWDELKELAGRLAQVVPDNRYTGWDLALTDTGWIMVEGNRRAQFGWQYATRVGFRSEINGIMSQLGLKY